MVNQFNSPTAIIIETERLLIRKISQQDFKEFDILCSDPEIMKFVGDGKPLSQEQTQRWINVTINNYKEKGFGVFGVIDKITGVLIGYCGLVFSEPVKDYELIYALSKSWWGQGLATKIAKEMVAFGFNSLLMKCIYASIDPENIASQKILLKIGFKEIGTMNDEYGLESIYYEIKR